MLNPLGLAPFQLDQAQLIAQWITSASEAAQWANTPWPVDPAVFARWHTDPEIQPYVLWAGASLIGYGELWLTAAEQEVELARLLVAPRHRGQGIGQRLVHELLARARLSGYPMAFLRVVPDNEAALRCYRKSGFTAVTLDEQERYNRGQPVTYLWLRLPLKAT